MLDQDKSLFLQKKRPPKGMFWVHARLDEAFKHPFRNSKSPYGGKWASEELFAGNIYDEQMTSKKQARWAAWSNLPRNNEPEEAPFIFVSSYKNI